MEGFRGLACRAWGRVSFARFSGSSLRGYRALGVMKGIYEGPLLWDPVGNLGGFGPEAEGFRILGFRVKKFRV